MTDPAPVQTDRRPGRIAALLGISRATARGLLAIPHEHRDPILAELAASQDSPPAADDLGA